MNPSQLIAELNALEVGDMDRIASKLERARRACLESEQAELSETLREAAEALERLDLKTYRKRLATAVARLGHLK